jgi:hypothetical protein
VALLDERLILPVEKAAVEVRGGQPLATTALGLYKYDFYSLSVGKVTDHGLVGQTCCKRCRSIAQYVGPIVLPFLVRLNR